jgi:hypothetical protein
MPALDSDTKTLATVITDPGFDEAQVAAAASLARHNGRTLDAYRTTSRHPFSGPSMWDSPSQRRSGPISSSIAR